jgi:hypothetical protein
LWSGWLNEVEVRRVAVQDPLRDGMEAAADARLDQACGILRDLVRQTPGDAEAWACLVVVEEWAGHKAELREALAGLRAAQPDLWRELLKTWRRRLEMRRAENLAEKEARGLSPYPVVTPRPTPDQGIWVRVEAERRPSPTPMPALLPADRLLEGVRIGRGRSRDKKR